MTSSSKTHQRPGRWGPQAICGWIFVLCFAGFVIGSRYFPVTPEIRILFVATLVFAILNILIFFSRLLQHSRWMLFPALLLLVLGSVLIFLGSESPDPVRLREAYVRELRLFENAPYAKGGETADGIDASGLARTALWQAMLKQGVQQMNLRLLGPSLWKFWWRDLTTGDLIGQKYGYTVKLSNTANLAKCETKDLIEGDLAVTDPFHVLIYCGNGIWIDASPEKGKVLSGNVGSKGNWSQLPVTVLRWQILINQKGAKNAKLDLIILGVLRSLFL
jgi:NlpC/P60 family